MFFRTFSLVRRKFTFNNVIYANTAFTIIISGAADIVEQKLIKGRIDFKRSFNVGLSGVLLGPMNTVWYRVLDHRFPGKQIKEVLKKVSADIIVSPAFASTFICSVAILEGASSKEALMEYRKKFFAVLKLDLLFWPPVQALNFIFVAPKYRVAYVLTSMFFYNTILTYIKHNT